MILTLAIVDSLPGKPHQITGDPHGGPVVLTNPKFGFRELRPWQIMSLRMSVHQGRVVLMYYWSLEDGKSRGKVPEWHFSFHIRAAVWSVTPHILCGWSPVIPPQFPSPSPQLLTRVWAVSSLKSAGQEHCNEKKKSGKSHLFSQVSRFSLFSPDNLFLSHSVVIAGKWHVHSNRREWYSKPVY